MLNIKDALQIKYKTLSNEDLVKELKSIARSAELMIEGTKLIGDEENLESAQSVLKAILNIIPVLEARFNLVPFTDEASIQ